ncbi:DoxX family protein [Nitrospirillum sp. BR 11164]|uniref:DoxX family protein n=1 Tax=Nitrospirillum sp. BR 11164 TaxID=3104324 RepID=UPI002AFFFA4D|nr:DoxX family protein [Nitrospirillum sp. BR 11164]MEA1648543.1 DoxX family protein [Nitrospirillum sp. BR 11164]
MPPMLPIWFLAAAFLGAGVFNAIGTAGVRMSFVRWGFPGWWCRVTGALEILVALLIALPAGRSAGLILGAIVIASASLTVVRRREFSHLAPLGLFAVLLAVAEHSF